MPDMNANQYLREAQKIHSALFPGVMPLILAERFRLASEQIDAAASSADLAAYHEAIERTEDLEALELAARLTRRLPLLSRKLHVMAYLGETLPDYQRYYVNTRSSFVRALLTIGWETLASVLKALKGLWMLRRLGHA